MKKYDLTVVGGGFTGVAEHQKDESLSACQTDARK